MKIVSFTDINSLLYIGVENEINTESKTTTETKKLTILIVSSKKHTILLSIMLQDLIPHVMLLD